MDLKAESIKLKNRKITVFMKFDDDKVVIESKKLIKADESMVYINNKPADSYIIAPDGERRNVILQTHLCMTIEGAFALYAMLHKLINENDTEIEKKMPEWI